MNPGNANLPIGVLCFGTVANREIGVPRLESEIAAVHFRADQPAKNLSRALYPVLKHPLAILLTAWL